jgi:hypothetical protein
MSLRTMYCKRFTTASFGIHLGEKRSPGDTQPPRDQIPVALGEERLIKISKTYSYPFSNIEYLYSFCIGWKTNPDTQSLK